MDARCFRQGVAWHPVDAESAVVFFRFAAAVMLVVAVSMAQIGLQKASLELHRRVSRQYYEMDELLELHARLRLDIQKLSAPSRFAASPSPPVLSQPSASPATGDRTNDTLSARSLPLLRWERPAPAGDDF